MAKQKGKEEMISGISMCLVFSTLWIVFGQNFWAFPLVFAGIIPAVRGTIRFLSTRKLAEEKHKEIEYAGNAAMERSILKTAREENGKVTPALVALHTDISIMDADNALQDMVKRGYASMDVNDNGTVVYVFQEFLPE